jgi:hypothetical protein
VSCFNHGFSRTHAIARVRAHTYSFVTRTMSEFEMLHEFLVAKVQLLQFSANPIPPLHQTNTDPLLLQSSVTDKHPPTPAATTP